MATNDRHSGTLRTDYETDLAHPDELRAMESEWQRLMHRTVRYGKSLDYRDDDGREGSLAPLLENHVLTVVADIMRKRLSGYGESFTDAEGTTEESAFSKKLETDIEGWIDRLNAFIGNSWTTGRNESPAVAAAIQIRDSLNNPPTEEVETEKHRYYRMLRIVRSIQEHAGYYLEQIENSGDVGGALSLLVAYLKNYAGIAASFDHRLAELPSFYRKEILHVKPGAVVQDNAYIVVRPTEKCTLKAGQGFLAGQNAGGDDLIYRTVKDETVSPVQCAEVDAVYLIKDNAGKTTGIRRQTIRPDDATVAALFDAEQGEALAFGWQQESSMFIMNEGEREVSISFDIKEDTAGTLPPDGQKIKGFTFHLSSADGWAEQKNGSCLVSGGRLCFRFTIGRDGTLPAACSEEIHGKSTAYPILRILTDGKYGSYDRVSGLEITGVEIRTHVRGIRDFTFYNELGEVDTTQPFQPFGIQAERGAWFLFGNEEMGMKPLTGIHIKGIWQKMPETEKELNDRYRDYGVDASSFKIGTEWQTEEKWHTCKDEPQLLFGFDEEGKLCPADVYFDFSGARGFLQSNRYEYSRDEDGFFRVTLQSPSIGFGTDEYRKKFTDILIHNSRCKEKDRKPLPQEPVIPMLADVELEYEAVEKRTVAPQPELIVVSDGSETRFKSRPADEEDKALYFSFIHAAGEQTLRFYLDMVIPPKNIPCGMPEPEGGVSLIWEYWKEGIWRELPSTSVTSEETRGLTQSGFIEIKLPEKLVGSFMDRDGKAGLRASVKGGTDSCLALRGVWTNCLRLTAQNGDGQPLPAGTIQDMQEADGRIENIVQPLPGFGGKPAGTESSLSAHLTARIGNRHRAVNARDYEQIVLEHFPEVDKAVCLPCSEKGKREVRLVVFSRSEDGAYYLSPSWKLTEIRRTMQEYVPPFVRLEVMNPVYQEIKVTCKAVLRGNVQDEGKVVRNLIVLAQNYLAPWKRKGEIPDLQQGFSYKELHSRMANHEDLQTLVELRAGGISLPVVDFDSGDVTIKGDHPWNVLTPRIEIILLSPDDGIESAEIGSSFIITD